MTYLSNQPEEDPVLTIAWIMLKAGQDKERAFSTDLMLCHSKLSEAYEAYRNNEGSERKAEKLADVVINICELAYHNRLPLIRAIIDRMNMNSVHGKLY